MLLWKYIYGSGLRQVRYNIFKTSNSNNYHGKGRQRSLLFSLIAVLILAFVSFANQQNFSLAMASAGCNDIGEDTGGESISWWKGNTHTHTLWSDGNGLPESVAGWYRTHGYQFLVLSDHNILSVGEKWMDVSDDEKARVTPQMVAELEDKYGEDWVVTREIEGKTQIRLKTLEELRVYFEKAGEFIFIQGEELTDQFERKPVHVNGLNLVEVIKPQGGTSVADTMQRNINAVIKHGKEHGLPTLAHVNHPNFGWGLTTEDIASIKGEKFFEVYNGHSSVRNYGDNDHVSMEQMWDIALTIRLTDSDPESGLLYGLATDDAHDYYHIGVGKPNPGRGWLMVRAETLAGDAIIKALNAGDFYASSGVTLAEIKSDRQSITITIQQSSKNGKDSAIVANDEDDVVYTTQFIGTRLDKDNLVDSEQIGVVLYETTENPAVYSYKGDELYVRAKVISSELHPNPYAAGDFQCAWVQPVLPLGLSANSR